MTGVPKPLEGVRVFELSVAIAAPICGRTLAHFGAEVVKVETRGHPDVIRLVGSSWISRKDVGPDVWADCGPLWNEFAGGKRSLGVDLKTDAGREIARRLIRRSDVFLSNYSAPAVRALGFDDAQVRAIRPDIVYASVSGFGTDPESPYYGFRAWGPNQAPLIGLDELTGWPDRAPSGLCAFSYPDFSNALHAAFAILVALEHRDRTGEGASIDLSQQEGTAAILGPWLVEAQQGNRPRADANGAPGFAPHGIYPTCEEDRYVAIAVGSDEHWSALCDVAGRSDWRTNPRFATFEARLAAREELDDGIAAWTRGDTDEAIAELLQRAGVPAAPVLDNARVAIDPQLREERFWMLPAHARFGRDLVTGCPVKLSRSPGALDRGGPSLGEDNDYVLAQICGYTPDEIERLIAEKVAEPMSRPGEVRLERRYWPRMRDVMPELPWPNGEKPS